MKDLYQWNDVELIDYLNDNLIMSYQEIGEKQLSRKQMIELIETKNT